MLPVLTAGVLTLLLLTAGFSHAPAHASAENAGSAESSIDSNALVTYGYLQTMLEQWKQELLRELAQSDSDVPVTLPSSYTEISLSQGTILQLHGETEAIFRGGDAIVITVSAEAGRGLTDLSANRECFSGEFLQFGHIYYKTNAQSRTYILITGERAAFTMKGTYETY